MCMLCLVCIKYSSLTLKEGSFTSSIFLCGKLNIFSLCVYVQSVGEYYLSRPKLATYTIESEVHRMAVRTHCLSNIAYNIYILISRHQLWNLPTLIDHFPHVTIWGFSDCIQTCVFPPHGRTYTSMLMCVFDVLWLSNVNYEIYPYSLTRGQLLRYEACVCMCVLCVWIYVCVCMHI